MFKVKELPFRSVEWLCENKTDIDEKPVYQRRGKVWSTKDKAFLIDSILNDYDIPKIYLADFTSGRSPLNERKKRYAIIDGKQRLEAITEFFEGKIALEQNFQYAADTSLTLGGQTYRDLLRNYPDVARKFRDYKLVIMGVTTDEPGKINDLFIRLNRSKPLVGSEVRNAMLGLVPPLIRKLAAHKFFKTRICFETRRLQDRNAAAKILLIEFRGQFVDTKKSQLDDFVTELADEALRAEVFLGGGLHSKAKSLNLSVRRCRKVLNEMNRVFRERDPLLRSQGPLTVYYWFVKEYAAQYRLVRQFFVEFDTIRRENKKRASMQPQPPGLDPELLNFEILSRSPNDQASCARRYSILKARFEAFLKREPTNAPRAEQIPLIEGP